MWLTNQKAAQKNVRSRLKQGNQDNVRIGDGPTRTESMSCDFGANRF